MASLPSSPGKLLPQEASNTTAFEAKSVQILNLLVSLTLITRILKAASVLTKALRIKLHRRNHELSALCFLLFKFMNNKKDKAKDMPCLYCGIDTDN
jgi:hypothetical protein